MTASDCSSLTVLLGPHLDGALDTVNTLHVEEHLGVCETCRERHALNRALRGSLKEVVSVRAPDEMRSRMLAAMKAEVAASKSVSALEQGSKRQSDAAQERRSMLRNWRTFAPVATAAALVMAWGSLTKQHALGDSATLVPTNVGEDLLRDFVGQHSHSLPSETADPKQVRQFERYVGVPVRVPRFDNAHFVGGRLMPVHGGERAAMLQYEVNRGASVQRVSVFVYDPRKIQLGGSGLAPRAVGTASVRVGQADGYSVAITQHGGVGYAMASDLDQDSSATLVSTVEGE